MKSFILCSLIFLNWTLVIPSLSRDWSFADIYLRDVPDGHYAYDSIYDLVNRGVTNGYPDGTFRGKKPMTRYDLAAFLARLSQSFDRQSGKQEKIVAELRTEAAELRVAGPAVTGQIDLRWRRGTSGELADYRLRVNYLDNFPGDSSLKITLDTMDSGFDGTTRDLVREMLDIEGKTKIGNTVIKVTDGPGDVLHTDTLFPADNKIKYRRPRRTIGFTSTIGKTELAIEYLARSTAPSGLVQIAELSTKLSANFRPVKLVFNPRIFMNDTGGRDSRLDLIGEYNKLASLTMGMTKTTPEQSGFYVKGDVALGDYFHLLAQKVGSRYRQSFTYSLFDLFDRDVPDGSTSIGLEAKKDFTSGWSARVKGDVTNPGNILTTEFRVGKNIHENTWLEVMTQSEQSNLAYGLAAGIVF